MNADNMQEHFFVKWVVKTIMVMQHVDAHKEGNMDGEDKLVEAENKG